MSLLPSIIFRGDFCLGQKKITCILLFLFSFVYQIEAQTTGFLYFNSENGLINNQATSLEQDDDGRLFIGTMAGLSVFDGDHFTSFGKNQGLAEQWITSLKKDKEGNIWIGHWSGGTSRWNKKTELIENIQTEKLFNFSTVSDIEKDDFGNIWFATEGEGIFFFNPETKTINQLANTKKLNVSDIFIKGEKILAACDQGLIYIRTISKAATATAGLFGLTQGLFSKNLTAVAIDVHDMVWMGSADGGISAIELKYLDEPTIFRKQIQFTENQKTPSQFIKKIYIDKKFTVWVGTAGGGVAYFSYANGHSAKDKILGGYFTTFNTTQGLNYYSVNAIFQDRENSYWFATDMGLNQYRGDFYQLFDEQDGLSGTIVWSIYSNKKGTVWLGTNKGLSMLSREKNKNNYSCKSFLKKEGYPEEPVWSVYEDKESNLWIGTSSGVFLLRKSKNKIQQITINDGLASNNVVSFGEDNAGYIWCGTKEGLSRISKNDLSIKNFTAENGLPSGYVYKIFTDSKNRTWFSCLGTGIRTLMGDKLIDPFPRAKLNEKFIMAFAEDSKGKIWMATYGSGIYSFDGDSLQNYSVKEGLSSDMTHSIVSDKQNNIWVGSNKGIEKFNQTTGKIFLFAREQGLMGEETNPGAADFDEENNLWFGTIGGALKLNLNNQITNLVRPTIRVSGVKINFSEKGFPIDNVFSSKENNLSFVYSAVSLLFPEKLYFEYTLFGHDHTWVRVNPKVREAHYTNLSAGKYIFKVRAINSDGIISETASYSFEIKPPFWQTALFFVSVFIFILFVLFALEKNRTRKRKKEIEKRRQLLSEFSKKYENTISALDAEKQKIKEELMYAKKIYELLIKSPERNTNELIASFSIEKQKDILGGDFTWHKKNKDRQYFAAIDSFATGVPSALLANYIKNTLDQAASETNEKTLETLAFTILSGKNNSLVDKAIRSTGIALCSIDEKNKQFSLYCKNASVIIIREAKLLLCFSGGMNQETVLIEDKLNYLEGDELYLFTDGFEDLFFDESLFPRSENKVSDYFVNLSTLDYKMKKEVIQDFINTKENVLLDDLCLLSIKFN